MTKNKILKKIGAGLLSGLCTFSMLGTSLGGVLTASAASTSTTENSAFPSADVVIAKASTLLGSPYSFGCKGYSGIYTQGAYSPLTVEYINNQGIDCSGLIYYTLTQLGYKTTGFSWNNPVPVDTSHWLSVDSDCTISYGGKTSNIDVEKSNLKTKDYEYWECKDGSTITPGSVVIAQNPEGIDHSWIYLGEFNSRSDVVSYLKSIGVSSSLITSKTVGDGTGDGGTHWRIESSGSEGVVINNKTDGKSTSAMNMSAIRITKTDVTFSLKKHIRGTTEIVGKSPIDNSNAVYGIYSDKSCTKKIGSITIGANGIGSVKLPNSTYYAKETKAPTGFTLDSTVYPISEGITDVYEDETEGKILINKTSEDGVVGGREFKLSYTYKGKAKSETVKTNAKGIAVFDDLKVYDTTTGKAISYTVSEINVDTRYVVPKSQTVKLSDYDNSTVDLTCNLDFVNSNKKGTVKVVKDSEDGTIKGFTIKLTGSDGSSYTKTTNANGIAEFPNLNVYDKNNKLITYTAQETNVPVRYVVPPTVSCTLSTGATVTKNITNDLKKGDLKVIKDSEDGTIKDFTIKVTGSDGSSYIKKTNANGVAEFIDLNVYDSDNTKILYTVQEINVPVRYVTPPTVKCTIITDTTTTKDITNVLKKFTAEVTKKDSEKANAQGNGTLAGAVYGLYLDGELVDKYTTDKKGYFKTKQYTCGNYTIKEITASEGYLLDETEYTVGAESKNYTVESNMISLIVTEDAIKGNVAIIKHSDNGSTQIETPEVGAEFEVYLKSSGSYEKAVDTVRDILICDENGFAQSKDMPYGVYTVHQTKGIDGAEMIADFDVTISENGKTYRYLINNAPFESYVKVVKVDSETGKTINYAGAGFEIYKVDGEKISMTFSYPTPTTIDTFYTNSEGRLVTPQTLAYGEYSLVEVQAPYGYVLDSTPVKFTVSANDATEENAMTVIKVTKKNTAQKGIISVTKTGDIFSSVTALGSTIMKDENGVIHTAGSSIYTPIFTSDKLSGAVYEITAVEDIVTADGTIRVKSGEKVAEIKTDENGYAQSDLLYLGKYEVKEITAPLGYVLNDTPQQVELSYVAQEVEVTDTMTSFENEYQRIEISLAKYMETDDPFGIGNNGEYKAVRFGLFADEQLTASDKTTIPKDGLIEEISLNEDMTAQFTTPIPFGKYYVQEIATDEHYVLNGEKYLVNFEYMGQDIRTVNIDCGTFRNTLKRGNISGVKIDNDTNEPLENAHFGLFAKTTTEYKLDNAIMTAVSDENGCFSFHEIAYGEYVIREIKAPNGYILSDEIYPITISDDEQTIRITAENSANSFEISKTDVLGEELIGASLQLEDKDENVIEKWVSDGTSHIVSKLAVGDYVLRETCAPDGYCIATEVSISIDKYGVVTQNGKVVDAVSSDGRPLIVLVDEATQVYISKTDITGENEVIGATLEIIDKDGKIVEGWISSDKAHVITAKLIAGETYTLHEAQAPNGYVIASDIKFTVSTDGTVDKVVMKDDTTKVEISKTDITGESELTGAVLQITDNDGNVVDEWLSNGEIHKVYGLLIAGEKYTLHEVSAPQGYELADDIEFTVSTDGSVDKVVMKDEKTPDTPTTPNTPSTPDNPKTGMDSDDMCVIYLALVASLIVCGIVMNVAKLKKIENESEEKTYAKED